MYVVVMLTQLVERGRIIAHQYWTEALMLITNTTTSLYICARNPLWPEWLCFTLCFELSSLETVDDSSIGKRDIIPDTCLTDMLTGSRSAARFSSAYFDFASCWCAETRHRRTNDSKRFGGESVCSLWRWDRTIVHVDCYRHCLGQLYAVFDIAKLRVIYGNVNVPL